MFVYLISLFVLAMVLLFGYKAMGSAQRKKDQALLIRFKSQLTSDIRALKGDYGSLRTKFYDLPSGFDELCFVDLQDVDTSYILEKPLIKDSVTSGINENIFLIGKGRIENIFVEGLALTNFPYFVCLRPNSGRIKLKIEGSGDKASIKITSITHCKNAEDSGLCSGLDVVFGEGYENDCCEEHGLCC
ncbi:hypothetical protein KY358_02155 [Candidatus Woesearchaeota archaeon]|nr:hypothetical protein [Candidatus Woesearchaeota archaeon]